MKTRIHDRLEDLDQSLAYEDKFTKLIRKSWNTEVVDLVGDQTKALLTAQSILPNYLFKAIFHRLFLHETYAYMEKIGIKSPRWTVNKAIRLLRIDKDLKHASIYRGTKRGKE